MTVIVYHKGFLAADRSVIVQMDNWAESVHSAEKIFVSHRNTVAIAVSGPTLEPHQGKMFADLIDAYFVDCSKKEVAFNLPMPFVGLLTHVNRRHVIIALHDRAFEVFEKIPTFDEDPLALPLIPISRQFPVVFGSGSVTLKMALASGLLLKDAIDFTGRIEPECGRGSLVFDTRTLDAIE